MQPTGEITDTLVDDTSVHRALLFALLPERLRELPADVIHDIAVLCMCSHGPSQAVMTIGLHHFRREFSPQRVEASRLMEELLQLRMPEMEAGIDD